MILKALYDYYNRCGNLPRKGTELKEIGYLIVIDNEGTFIRIESRMIDKKHASQYLVGQTVQRSGKQFISNFLWDNCKYVTGYSENNEDNALLCKNAFIKRVQEIQTISPHNAVVKAVSGFYHKYSSVVDILKDDKLWGEMSTTTKNISFLIQGSTFIAAEDKDVVCCASNRADESDTQICLVSGNKGKIARIHAKVPLQGNAFTSLVSFKDGKGYDSYGKEQGANAPISEDAEFAYTTALNHLLETNSQNKFMIGSRTFVFWASKGDEAGQKAEESLFSMFGFNEQKDDPDRGIEQVRKVFESIHRGILKTTSEDTFYILGLAPNSARIAVTYWAEIPLREFAERICRHFYDMEVVDMRPEKKPYMSLHNIISAVTLDGKVSDATPNLPESVVKSIFEGLPYPQTLFASCIRRIRAESGKKDKEPIVTRAAIIKAYLNRLNNNQKPIEAMLDKENSNQGYLCGRLFAVLDKIQEKANNQHSIRERYMNSASSTPAAVFSTILNLSNHHMENLKNEGQKIYFEKLKQEIISKIDAGGFKAQLDLQDQGRFFIGYYHQRQDLS